MGILIVLDFSTLEFSIPTYSRFKRPSDSDLCDLPKTREELGRQGHHPSLCQSSSLRWVFYAHKFLEMNKGRQRKSPFGGRNHERNIVLCETDKQKNGLFPQWGRPGLEADKSLLVIQYLNQNWHLFISTAENCFCEALIQRLLPLFRAYQWCSSLLLISQLPFRQQPLVLVGPQSLRRAGRESRPHIQGAGNGGVDLSTLLGYQWALSIPTLHAASTMQMSGSDFQLSSLANHK